MGVIDEVKQRSDIVEVIGQYASLKKAGRNLTALCPFHSEKHPSFFVYPEQQSWHCFGACGTGGDVFAFIMKKENLDFGEALRLLAQKAGVTLPSKIEREGGKDEKEEFYKINEAAALYFHNLLLNSPAAEKARGYIAKRGFSPKTVADFQLGFSLDSWESLKQYLREKGYDENKLVTAGLLIKAENGKIHDRFRGKLMFPIRDIRGHTIGFGARVLDDSLPKYINSPQSPTFDKSSSLYGIDLAAAAIRKQDAAIIMEGYMDVITAHQNGITNAIASMGTAITEMQVNTLKKLSKNLILALDADTGGEEAMLRGVGYENTLNSEIRVIVLPEGTDPDDVIKKDVKLWQDLVIKALPIVDYTFNMVTSKLDLNTAKNKSAAREKLLPVVAEIKDTTRQTHYLGKLASITKDNIRNLETALRELKASQGRQKAKAPGQETTTRALRPLVSNAREEYCLSLLLQHPELKGRQECPSPEYFENSENREIFTACQKVEDPVSLKESLNSCIHEHFEAILNRSLIIKNMSNADIEKRFDDCVLELKKQYLRNMEARRAEVLALEAASGGTGADLARLEEEGIETSTQLKEVFTHRQQKQSEVRR